MARKLLGSEYSGYPLATYRTGPCETHQIELHPAMPSPTFLIRNTRYCHIAVHGAPWCPSMWRVYLLLVTSSRCFEPTFSSSCQQLASCCHPLDHDACHLRVLFSRVRLYGFPLMCISWRLTSKRRWMLLGDIESETPTSHNLGDVQIIGRNGQCLFCTRANAHVTR